MHMDTTTEHTKRRAINLTIREDVLKEAKELSLNTSRAAEKGIADAVKKAKEEAWVRDNWDAIQAYNKRIREQGLPIKAWWMRDGQV